jgi:7-cyano-7-deazaguanine synthase in queuosine biosynthesis
MPNAVVEVDGRTEPLVVQINGQRPTFRLRSDAIDKHLFRNLDDRHLDFLEIASAVFHADGSVPRGGATRPDMGQDWRRSFRFTFHVRDLQFWGDRSVRSALVNAIEFLTEDRVSVEFARLEATGDEQEYLPLARESPIFQADRVILFSGGLDSFAGALETLDSTAERVVLVTHRSAQKVIPRQHELGGYLASRFPGRVLHLEIMARRVGQEAVESTQRSRSLLFSALALAVAHGFGAKRIDFFENGIISHNLPLSRQIVGTMATRTTHPLALRHLSTLLDLVGPAHIPIENVYAWKTKTEVVRRIAEHGGQQQIAETVSCTSVREQNSRHTHCGACSQCLDRRFGILAAGLGEFDFADNYATEVLFGSRDKEHSRNLANEWTRHAKWLAAASTDDFLTKFGHEFSRIARGHITEDSESVLTKTVDMHRRHGAAVLSVLGRTISEHFAELAEQTFPATSLIRTWVGSSDSPLAEGAVIETIVGGDGGEWDVEAPPTDYVPDPAGPLRVAFLQEGKRYVVIVQGLGRVSGAPARVPHALRSYLETDRAAGLSPQDHRYVHLERVSELADLGLATPRQYVNRCRKELAKNYRDIHGHEPNAALLIQNKVSKGHRLDPTIVIVESAD